MTAEQNRAVVHRVVQEIWNLGDLELADALFVSDYVNHGGLIPDFVQGPEAIKISVALYRTAFPDLHITVEDLVVEEEGVMLHWAARGASPGELVGPTTVRNHGALRGSTLSRVAKGMIVESWTRWDSEQVLQHLGMIIPE